jgi:hypothetical protein
VKAQIRKGLTFANVISMIALFVALGGGAYAAVKLKANQVKSKNIAPNAVQGIDANEASFGPVPRASQADNAATAGRAATAGDADTVEGIPLSGLQEGNGFDDAIAGFVDEGDTAGHIVFEGAIGLTCEAIPELIYDDFGPDGFDTDIWVNGAHQIVPDGANGTPVALAAGSDTAKVVVWGSTVADVTASIEFEGGGPDECAAAFSSQENLATGAARSGSAPKEPRRAGLPDGWVAPSPGR